MHGSVFVDTSAWVGAFVARDQHHEAAARALEELGEEGTKLITTDYVLAETVTRLRRQADVEHAGSVWDELESGELAQVLDVTPGHRAEARRIFGKFRELPLSLVDCVSFAVMNSLGVRRALTFDSDFTKAGYVVLPRKK